MESIRKGRCRVRQVMEEADGKEGDSEERDE